MLYGKNSASASMNVEGDNYFDNENLLKQFQRFFQLLPFKVQYENHNFVCLVDNPKTYTVSEFSINDFGMKPGTKCPVDKLEFVDEDSTKKIIKCYDDNGVSKGLLTLANELNMFVPKKCSPLELKLLLSIHIAFKKRICFR